MENSNSITKFNEQLTLPLTRGWSDVLTDFSSNCSQCRGTGRIFRHIEQDCSICQRKGNIRAGNGKLIICPSCSGYKFFSDKILTFCPVCRT